MQSFEPDPLYRRLMGMAPDAAPGLACGLVSA